MQTYLEQAFGKSDCSSVKMRGAVREWMDLYYGASRSGEDGSARLAVLIVSKLCRTVFAEYDVHRDKHDHWAQECYTDALNKVAKTAMQYALIGGECLWKVVDHFVPIRRDCYLPLGRDDKGNLTSVGMMQTLYENGKKYVLLERRTDMEDNTLIENRLFEVNGQALGRRVPLDTLTACKMLSDDEFLPNVPCMGLAVLRMPTVNCVDGSADPVSIYAPAVGLMHALARCEDQLNHEFLNGASRVFASEDLLRPDASGARGLRDVYAVQPRPGLDPAEADAMAVCAVADAMYEFDQEDAARGLAKVTVGSVSETYTAPPELCAATLALRAAHFRREAGYYLQIGRWVHA